MHAVTTSVSAASQQRDRDSLPLGFERVAGHGLLRAPVPIAGVRKVPFFSMQVRVSARRLAASPRVENKAQWLASIGKAPHLFRNIDPVQIELHGDIAITYGRYRARFKVAEAGRRDFTVWFQRV